MTTTYLIVMIALFFLDTIIFIFIQMLYASDRTRFSLFILSLAFLSGLVYFIETIIVFSFRSMLVLPRRQNQRYGGILFFSAAELYRITGAGGPCGEKSRYDPRSDSRK